MLSLRNLETSINTTKKVNFLYSGLYIYRLYCIKVDGIIIIVYIYVYAFILFYFSVPYFGLARDHGNSFLCLEE